MSSDTATHRSAAYRQRYDSEPTLLLPKVDLPVVDTSGWLGSTARFILHIILCVVTFLLALCLLPFLLPISFVFRLYRSALVARINGRKGSLVMAGMDALWLQDSPVNRAVIHTAMFMRGRLTPEAFEKLITERFVEAENPDKPGERWFPKVTKYPTQVLHRYTWLDEDNFRVSNHVVTYHKPVPDTQPELETLISEIVNTPFPPETSPWQLVIIPASQKEPDRYIVIFRGHHCLADGLSWVQILVKQMIDQEPMEHSRKRLVGSRSQWLPLVKAILEGPLFLFELLGLRSDSHVLHGAPLSGHKLVTWSAPIDLLLIKKIKNVTGTTVNDVLMSCLAGALRRHLVAHGGNCPSQIMSFVPVSLRHPSEQLLMDNQFVLIILPLPTHTGDSLQLLAHTAQRMNEIKRSPAPLINSAVMRYSMARLPNWMTQMTMDMFVRKCSLITSNVPGPQEHLTMCGQRIEDIVFWVPTRANIGMGVSLLSYAGTVRMGFICDKALLSNPHVIADSFVQEIQALAKQVHVE